MSFSNRIKALCLTLSFLNTLKVKEQRELTSIVKSRFVTMTTVKGCVRWFPVNFSKLNILKTVNYLK